MWPPSLSQACSSCLNCASSAAVRKTVKLVSFELPELGMTFLPSRSRTVKLDASPDCGIERSRFGRRIFDSGQRSCSSHSLRPLVALGPTFLRHALGPPSHFLEQGFDTGQPLVALDCEMER